MQCVLAQRSRDRSKYHHNPSFKLPGTALTQSEGKPAVSESIGIKRLLRDRSPAELQAPAERHRNCQEKLKWGVRRTFDGSSEYSRWRRSEPCFGSPRVLRRSLCKVRCPAIASISAPALPVVSRSLEPMSATPLNGAQ